MNSAFNRSANSFSAFAACFVLFVLVAPALAQRPDNRPANPMSAMNSPDQAAMRLREWNLTHMGEDADKHFKKDTVSLFPRIREDFTRIQEVDNDLLQTVFVKKSVDYKLISAAVAEINKRAARLKGNLVLPKLNEKQVEPASFELASTDVLKRSLLQMDHALISFVNNDLFKQPTLVNPDLASRARRDLESIIQVSAAIKRSLEKMK
jgi:hypothetical protein